VPWRDPVLYGPGAFCALTLLGGRALARWQRRRSMLWTWSLLGLPLALALFPFSTPLALGIGLASLRASRLGARWHSSDLVAGRDLAQAAHERLGIGDALARANLNRRIGRNGWAHGGSLVVGRDAAGFPVAIPLGGIAGSHSLILGATGSGKTVSEAWIAGRLIEQGHGAIVIDPKGDQMLRNELRRVAATANRGFLEWTPTGPCAYNPYASGSDSEIADKALAGEVFTEPHYLRQAQRYLGHAVRTMHAAAITVTVPALMAHLQPGRLEVTARALPEQDAGPVNDYLDSLTERQRRDLSGVRDRLSILAESDVRRWFDPTQAPTIDLRAAVRARAVVYFALDADRRPLLAQMVAAALISDLVTLAAHLQADPTPTVVLIDEFSALAARHVARLFGRARSAGMSLLLATQELADLQAADSNLRDQVLGNVEALIAHRQNVPVSAETIAKVASFEPVWLTSQQTGYQMGRYGATERGNRRRDYDYLVHPSRIQRLQTGQALIIAPGRKTRPKITAMHHPREANR
jgi:conjugal transfer pilus assembly protein TraD